jgi:predicted transposase/invertase (TIGR01784 family)
MKSVLGRREGGYQLSAEEEANMVEEPKIMDISRVAIGKYVDILSDVGFKIVFGKEANKNIIIEFLNHVITERSIVDFEYIDKEKLGGYAKSKKNVYDLYCKTDDGSRIIVEVQKDQQKYFVDRSLYYLTHLVQDQLSRGDDEYTLCPVYFISILNFCLDELSKSDSVRNHYRLKECDMGLELTDKYNLIYIELPKFKKSLEEIHGDVLDGFYYCLKHMGKLEERPLCLQQKVFEQLFMAAKVAKMTQEEYSQYVRIMTTERDRRNQLSFALEKANQQGMEQGIQRGIQKGIQQGMEQGRIAGKQELLIELIKSNINKMSIEQLADVLCISEKEVREIAALI